MGISLRISVSAAFLLCLAAACQTTPRLLGRDVEVLAQGRLAAVQPVDIAIAPIQLTAAGAGAPAHELRKAAQFGLARRRYTPLSLALVDQAIAGGVGRVTDGSRTLEASYVPGDLKEDAVLEVTVLRWNARNWDIRRSLEIELEARLIDPRDPLGPELWAARLNQSFDFSSEIGATAPASRGMQAACNRIFVELLSKLPARDVGEPVAPALEPIPASASRVPATAPATAAGGAGTATEIPMDGAPRGGADR